MRGSMWAYCVCCSQCPAAAVTVLSSLIKNKRLSPAFIVRQRARRTVRQRAAGGGARPRGGAATSRQGRIRRLAAGENERQQNSSNSSQQTPASRRIYSSSQPSFDKVVKLLLSRVGITRTSVARIHCLSSRRPNTPPSQPPYLRREKENTSGFPPAGE